MTRQLLANGTEVLFQYDKRGNLTEVQAGPSLTRFEYAALNRLTAVVTDTGQRLEYSYEPGEIRSGRDHMCARVPVQQRSVRDRLLDLGQPDLELERILAAYRQQAAFVSVQQDLSQWSVRR